MDVKDLQRKWQEVAKVCASEKNMAPPSKQDEWEQARVAAAAVAEALVAAAKAEQIACKKWQTARAGPGPKTAVVGGGAARTETKAESKVVLRLVK